MTCLMFACTSPEINLELVRLRRGRMHRGIRHTSRSRNQEVKTCENVFKANECIVCQPLILRVHATNGSCGVAWSTPPGSTPTFVVSRLGPAAPARPALSGCKQLLKRFPTCSTNHNNRLVVKMDVSILNNPSQSQYDSRQAEGPSNH
jgi:hypothetical protein